MVINASKTTKRKADRKGIKPGCHYLNPGINLHITKSETTIIMCLLMGMQKTHSTCRKDSQGRKIEL